MFGNVADGVITRCETRSAAASRGKMNNESERRKSREREITTLRRRRARRQRRAGVFQATKQSTVRFTNTTNIT